MYRVGFLGYKFMGKAHGNALARLPMFFPEAPETERHVLIGRDEEALADAADRFGFATTSTDWRDVLDAIDILYNLGPNYLHVEPSIAALDQGVNVFSEKPLAPTLDGAERLANAAADSDAMAGVAFNFRYVPALQYAKRLIDDGELGEIHHVRAQYLQDWLVDPDAPWSWRNDEEMAGSGALGDLGTHTVDLIHFLVGDIARVSGQLKTFVEERPVEGEDARGDSVGTASGDEREIRPVTVAMPTQPALNSPTAPSVPSKLPGSPTDARTIIPSPSRVPREVCGTTTNASMNWKLTSRAIVDTRPFS
jgi:predicted dehydrogenase